MAVSFDKQFHLPISRVKTIMKSSPEVENVSNESIHLVAKAAELFIQFLAQESLVYSTSDSELQYKDIAKTVETEPSLEFLREIIPYKITVKEYKQMRKKRNKSSCSDKTDNEF